MSTKSHPIHLRLPDDLMVQVRKRAEDERRPVSQMILLLIEYGLTAGDFIGKAQMERLKS